MQDSSCPLCGANASRYTLESLNGYRYSCPNCAGEFEIGRGANTRAERGELHSQIPSQVKAFIAQGKVPRIEFEAGSGSFTVISDVQKA
ncbi:hypothetical protein IAG25_33210 [Caballeronia sp. EK]|uniref:hypothetical protein n=1 Tax=Caballeronia sp. EK TaxID=2767469 RepID=UPI001655A8CE|nr:hypothetical protein [Caballeronia sp. EK]MBC8641687.1 hypothetical protein [Caballeronia sp. EK]